MAEKGVEGSRVGETNKNLRDRYRERIQWLRATVGSPSVKSVVTRKGRVRWTEEVRRFTVVLVSNPEVRTNKRSKEGSRSDFRRLSYLCGHRGTGLRGLGTGPDSEVEGRQCREGRANQSVNCSGVRGGSRWERLGVLVQVTLVGLPRIRGLDLNGTKERGRSVTGQPSTKYHLGPGPGGRVRRTDEASVGGRHRDPDGPAMLVGWCHRSP